MRFSRIKTASFWVMGFVLFFLILFIGRSAFAAANTLSAPRLGESLSAITANMLKPAACASMNLTTITLCPAKGKCNGTGASNLILGTDGNDTIFGKNGDDCIIPGGGDDTVQGNNGNDICVEGPGNDVYKACTVITP